MANSQTSSPLFSKTNIFLFLLATAATIGVSCDALSDQDRKDYIVYMGGLPTESEYLPSSHHQSILDEVVTGSSLAKDALVHSYKRSFNGFVAKLTEQEVEKLSGMKGIVSVFPNRILQLQTTRSWDFMGFPETVKRVPTAESDVVVGVLDTGIWPESASFSDDGFGPPPKKWKGVCQGGKNFTCNNKIIGARLYPKTAGDSARDVQGHGTHTASTAAGSIVKGASFFDLAKGTARGGVPSARIAVYRVCLPDGCKSSDILAGFDDAIADGVDILSVSLGPTRPAQFDQDPIAIGSFHAMQNGIITSHSAGNSGPYFQSTTSLAPWLLTVAASSTDRRIIDKVILGNEKQLVGIGINSFVLNGTKFPLAFSSDVSRSECGHAEAKTCWQGCLDSKLVKGKIVVCEMESNGGEPFHAGALGTVMIDNSTRPDVSYVYPLPATLLSTKIGDDVKSYYKSTKNPVATILKTEFIKDSEAPVVVSFSSRGPNILVADIIKPDISAPGVDILAAFSPMANPSEVEGDKRSVKYSILSGTSMACPHATGAAAYVKSFHPNWSPSAIKSALMTTAFAMNGTKNPEGVFAYGSGHIDPVKAVNAGLVYEALKDDYVKFLCDIGYDSGKVKVITNSSCPKATGSKGSAKDLNYPSFGALVPNRERIDIDFTRTVTNVGSPNSTYKAMIKSDHRIKVTVKPDVLSFKSLNEKKSFVVNVVGDGLPPDDIGATGSLVWSDGVHSVRSPIVVFTKDII